MREYRNGCARQSKLLSLFYALVGLLFCSAVFTDGAISTNTSSYSPSSNVELPHPRLSVRSLSLATPPSTAEIMAAGQLGGLLHPTREMADKKREAAVNLSFGKAIEAWNRHDYKNAAEMFRKHARKYPDSPWAAEAKLHVGCEASYNGRFTEAEDLFSGLITDLVNDPYPGARMVANKARLRYALVKVYRNDLDGAMDLFTQINSESSDWRQRTYASHWIQRLSRYAASRRSLLNCGTLALAHVLENQGKENAAADLMSLVPLSDNGFSMRMLRDLAANWGLMLEGRVISPAEIQAIPLPAIVQIEGRSEGDRGHFWVLEKLTGDVLEIRDPQLNGLFTQTLAEFSREWNGRVLVFHQGASLPGRLLAPEEMESLYGGCCGVPRKPDNLGNPKRNGISPQTAPNLCPQGEPIWRVNMVSMNLFVQDVPMWYSPPIGPGIEIQLSYNSQSSIANHEPFGNKWQFNYASYIVVDPSGAASIYMPDGSVDIFQPNGTGGYYRPHYVFNSLTKLAANRYELRFPDDTVYEYNIPAGTSSLQPFLVGIRDAHDLRLSLAYDANVNLTGITDAQGCVTTIQYGPSGLATNVIDPFGRSASFEYDGQGNLTRITDMGGYWSSFTYDADANLTSIGNDRGITQFRIEPADGISNASDPYPAPSAHMWENYRITITDPLGNHEEFYYNGYSSYGWHVSPNAYVPYASATNNNYILNVPRSFFYFTTVGGAGDGELDYMKNTSGGKTTYAYDTKGNRTSVKDPHGHTRTYVYNTMGRITTATDAKGHTTYFGYATNGVDLLTISNGLGVARLAYNGQHDITAITSRMGHATTFAYNGYGQPISQVDALGITNLFIYDASNRLAEIRRNGVVVETLTYDGLNRIRTNTDASGLQLTYSYNLLDLITNVLYPDGRSESFAYSACCPRLRDSDTDRGGRTTQYEYDSKRQLTQVTNPEKGVTRYEYDADGNRTRLIDPNGNATTWAYDAEDRVIRKTYADGKGLAYFYDSAGLLTDRVGGRGIVTVYAYDQNHNLLSINYSDSTPAVTNTYDAYNRLVQVVDGIGTNVYAYDSDSRLLTNDGPWANDTITYTFDALGRRTNLVVQGGSGPTGYAYDELNRLAGVSVGGGIYTYTYTDASPLVQRLDRPNGSYTTYSYDILNRLTVISNRKSTHEIINQFIYTYNDQDLRDSETISNGLDYAYASNEVVRYQHNNLNQMLSAMPPEQSFAYDDDGNMIRGYTPSGYVFSATYDAENRLIHLGFTNNPGTAFSNVYHYAANYLLAETRRYSNGVSSSLSRSIRDGFLDVQERDGANAVVREYAWGLNMGGGIGGLLCLRQAGQLYSYAYDANGNVTAVLDASQLPAITYSYDAFGSILSTSGSLVQPYCFSTKPRDSTMGLYDYGFRQYSPTMGRWLERDPLGLIAGGNPYRFVDNNAVNFIDPFGLITQSYHPTIFDSIARDPHSNWGGEHWSGGQWTPSGGLGDLSVPAMNAIDLVWKFHDIEVWQAEHCNQNEADQRAGREAANQRMRERIGVAASIDALTGARTTTDAIIMMYVGLFLVN